LTVPRIRIAVRSDAPPDAEALQWLDSVIAESMDRLRRMAVDQTLSPNTMARFAHIRAQLEPTPMAEGAKWQWSK
jgi:hypothetical protein